jgi:hypothetical protein
MASAEKKTKTDPVPKADPAPKKEAPAKDKTTPAADAPKAAEAPKADSSEAAGAAPKNYSRGEGQKPVTQAYKDNWNAIFAKKKKRR